MKKLSLITLILFLGFTSCKTTHLPTYTKVPASLRDHLTYKEGRKPIISVHRGGGEMDGLPENCIESFTYIVSKMPCIIECDIEYTKDSVTFMLHDSYLDRTTTGTGKVKDKTWAELQTLTLKDNAGKVTPYKIPTLDEVLKWGKNKVIYTLDVKRNTPYRKVIESVVRNKAENYAAIITYNLNAAVEVYKINPNLLISVEIMKVADYDRLHEAGIPDKNMIAFIGTREPKKELTDFLHAKGIMTILGVLGNLDAKAEKRGNDLYKTWVNDGADILSTDRPEAAYSVIK